MTENAKIIDINEYEKETKVKSILTEEMLDMFDPARQVDYSKKYARKDAMRRRAVRRKRDAIARLMIAAVHVIAGIGIMFMENSLIIEKLDTIVPDLIAIVMLIINVFLLTNSYRFVVSRIGENKEEGL